ncbi:glycerol-3-phosphate dehydrogenase/oxidase [Granulicella arctica]|uniref:Glycerol-3-phosphate dehydrogenase n=1 Tax=Granulicella arctica TaxID=940613 RepID=A0A7Y9PI97_9BACT|nr:glycerol-3-phosphate dehydrogenase/oxidase [Granulicella arctica]NYF80249.1 glycerol-3-phosphate dehydrogenase [Granulicella arctica]
MTRTATIAALDNDFDVLIIGGGATGLGIAVDAVTRGFNTALVEAGDFAQATSSRATKLVHGGVRYLASGQIHLVYEALHERAVMVRNAPHLVHPLPFIIPANHLYELPYYGAGLTLYDFLSGKSTLGPTKILGKEATLARIPGLKPDHLSGGVLYHDGQFNDARLALALARTAADHRAVIANYTRCVRLIHSGKKLTGAVVRDLETGAEVSIRAKVVINATGIFVDEIRRMDEPEIPTLLSVSRGTHIVVPADVLGGDNAIMVPKTDDGRVIFAIPWQGRVVIGTTDIPAHASVMEPGHTEAEIDYLLELANLYLARPIDRSDILAVFSGLRPLVTGKSATTSKLSREHHIDTSANGLITVAGGKWTTYRRMAEDTLNFAIKQGSIPDRKCVSATVALRGATTSHIASDRYLREYGTDASTVLTLMAHDLDLAESIDSELPYTFAQVLYAVREEMARTVEDVLSRRTRSILLDAKAAMRAAPQVAALMAKELGQTSEWQQSQVAAFNQLAQTDYLLHT